LLFSGWCSKPQQSLHWEPSLPEEEHVSLNCGLRSLRGPDYPTTLRWKSGVINQSTTMLHYAQRYLHPVTCRKILPTLLTRITYWSSENRHLVGKERFPGIALESAEHLDPALEDAAHENLDAASEVDAGSHAELVSEDYDDPDL
jgi:hypothetical protein